MTKERRSWKTEFVLGYNSYVEVELFAKGHAGCQHLVHLLGDSGKHWLEAVATGDKRVNYLITAKRLAGTIAGVRDPIAEDLVVRIEDLVLAEAFGNLLEQAEHLLSGGYFLPAGVLGRAVLEEHLRKWWQHSGCTPAKTRATISDFSQALYTSKSINKINLKLIDSLTVIGNDAAHVKDTLLQTDVESMLRELTAFLANNTQS